MEDSLSSPSDHQATLYEHLDELKRTIFYCLAILIIGSILIFPFHSEILQLLTASLQQTHTGLEREVAQRERFVNLNTATQELSLPSDRYSHIQPSSGVLLKSSHLYLIPKGESVEYSYWSPALSLQILNPVEGFVIALKITFWTALLVTSPLWLWRILRFILPALTPSESALLLPLLAYSYIALCIGLLATFFGTLPAANAYFYQFNASLGHNQWALSFYIQYALWLICANSIACECAALLFLLVRKGWITWEQLRDKRRHVIVGAFILAALLTPPDVFTQFLVAIPLIIFYEIILIYARYRKNYILIKT